MSEIDSFLIEGVSGSEGGSEGGEPEYLLPRTPPLSPEGAGEPVDPETQVVVHNLTLHITQHFKT